MKEWIPRARKDGAALSAREEAAMSGRHEITGRFARLLFQRGYESPEQVEKYLNPGLRYLERPEAWPGMARAADILAAGLRAGKKLAVWGDYDVDGVTSTALVREVLGHYGYDVAWHLPHRLSEGYGMNLAGVEDLAARGIDLLLTVDCGISEVQAVARAKELGMTVLVTDHHMPPAVLPEADALCDPRLAECPCSSLAGVGVAFLLMAAVSARLAGGGKPRFDMRHTLDLVALGTVADLVELEGQNRILVKNGLVKLAEASRPGLSELKAVCGFAPFAALEAGQVAFSLAPRINAAGRMASAETALELLCTRDYNRAAELARALNDYNSARRQEEERIAGEAEVQAEAWRDAPALVVAGKEWNLGVIGIVASRLVEKYHKPAIVLCRDGDTLKGSARSIAPFDLYGGLARCSGELLAFGGHRMAAGLRLSPERLEPFRALFLESVRQSLGSKPVPATQFLDGDLDFAAASDFTFLKELELMQPFGMGNPEPVFESPPLLVESHRLFGQLRNHVSLRLRDESCNIAMQARLWRQAGEFPESLKGERIRIAYSPFIDRYNGMASVEIKVHDWKPVRE